MKEKEIKLLEEYFDVYESGGFLSLEMWTDGGVNMIIDLDMSGNETIAELLKEYVRNFDVDEEIDIHRQSSDYKNAFTIRESVEDFENYINHIQCIVEMLEEIESEDEKVTLESILRKYFDLKGYLTKQIVDENDNEKDVFTEESEKCYGKLTSLIYDLGNIVSCIDSNSIIDELDKIESEMY